MARVTVEDCVTVIPNRFELCLVANSRAKSILSGATTTLGDTEKPSVIALREVAEGLVDVDKIRNNIIDSTKNRNTETFDDQLMQNTANEVIEESVNTMPLKDNIFLEDNIAVED
jgi:DNA-directed RNA polymerase subunit omega